MPLGYTRIIEQNVCIHAELITHSCAQNIHGNIRCMLELSLTVSLQIPRSVHSFFFHTPPPHHPSKNCSWCIKKMMNWYLPKSWNMRCFVFIHGWFGSLLFVNLHLVSRNLSCGRLQVCFENPSAPFSPFIRMGVVGRIFTEGNFEHEF